MPKNTLHQHHHPQQLRLKHDKFQLTVLQQNLYQIRRQGPTRHSQRTIKGHQSQLYSQNFRTSLNARHTTTHAHQKHYIRYVIQIHRKSQLTPSRLPTRHDHHITATQQRRLLTSQISSLIAHQSYYTPVYSLCTGSSELARSPTLIARIGVLTLP